MLEVHDMRASWLWMLMLPCLCLVIGCQSGTDRDEERDENDPNDQSFFDRLADAQNPSRRRKDDRDWENEDDSEDRYERRRRDRDRDRAWDDDNPYQELDRRRPVVLRVTWEALAHERALYERSEHRRPAGGIDPEMRIVLVSRSHPDARKAAYAQDGEARKQLSHTAVVDDSDPRASGPGARQARLLRSRPADLCAREHVEERQRTRSHHN